MHVQITLVGNVNTAELDKEFCRPKFNAVDLALGKKQYSNETDTNAVRWLISSQELCAFEF